MGGFDWFCWAYPSYNLASSSPAQSMPRPFDILDDLQIWVCVTCILTLLSEYASVISDGHMLVCFSHIENSILWDCFYHSEAPRLHLYSDPLFHPCRWPRFDSQSSMQITSGQIMPWSDCLKTKGNVNIKLQDLCETLIVYILLSTF